MKTLHDILSECDSIRYATETGTQTHKLLQSVVVDGDVRLGNDEFVRKILSHPELIPFFSADAQTEVPIAGNLAGRFISRRIDRIVLDHSARKILVMDYKTDTDKNHFRNKYIEQIREYVMLMGALYPKYKISGFILWVHDFSLEQLV